MVFKGSGNGINGSSALKKEIGGAFSKRSASDGELFLRSTTCEAVSNNVIPVAFHINAYGENNCATSGVSIYHFTNYCAFQPNALFFLTLLLLLLLKPRDTCFGAIFLMPVVNNQVTIYPMFVEIHSWLRRKSFCTLSETYRNESITKLVNKCKLQISFWKFYSHCTFYSLILFARICTMKLLENEVFASFVSSMTTSMRCPAKSKFETKWCTGPL